MAIAATSLEGMGRTSDGGAGERIALRDLIDRSLRTSVRLKNAWHILPVSADVNVVVRVCVFPEHPTEISLLKDSSLLSDGVAPSRVKEQL